MRHQATHGFAADHPAAAGHFPGNPIIPGVVLLQAVIAAIAPYQPGMICRSLISAKFLQPVRPGDMLDIVWDIEDGPHIRFAASVGTARAVTGALRFGAP